jgi:SWIM zinc finger
MTAWTAEQILALAPDASSAKNGKSLASLQKWSGLGQSEQAIWGECQGSGKDPYRAQIDRSEPAFKCSCPSRKFPCKHGLGLFLLAANQPAAITDASPPDWVSTWLASRAKRDETRQQKQDQQAAAAADPVAQAKRAEGRQRKVAAGVEELELWLQDRVRQGLASLQSSAYSFWDQPAARMIDAQAPGLARQLREMAGIPNAGGNWSETLLGQLGQLHLLLQGFQRLDTLPSPTQADIRTQIGWTQSQDDLLASNPLTLQDSWLVLGQRVEDEERLRVQRTWLWGQTSDHPALLLQFAHGSQPFETLVLPGSCFEGELAFYSSAYPLRVVLKKRNPELSSVQQIPGFKTIRAALAAYSQAIAVLPWLDRFPMSLQQVIPRQHNGAWVIQDEAGEGLALSSRFERGWLLLALSGGHPLGVFGEWQDETLLPLAVCVDQKFVVL